MESTDSKIFYVFNHGLVHAHSSYLTDLLEWLLLHGCLQIHVRDCITDAARSLSITEQGYCTSSGSEANVSPVL